MQVEEQVERRCIGLVPGGVPGGALVEVEEVPDTLTGLVGNGTLGGDAADGVAQRVGLCAELRAGPLAHTLFIYRAHANSVVGVGLQAFEGEGGGGDGGVDLTLVLDLVVVGILDSRPLQRQGIGLFACQLYVLNSCQCSCAGELVVGGIEGVAVDDDLELRGGDIDVGGADIEARRVLHLQVGHLAAGRSPQVELGLGIVVEDIGFLGEVIDGRDLVDTHLLAVHEQGDALGMVLQVDDELRGFLALEACVVTFGRFHGNGQAAFVVEVADDMCRGALAAQVGLRATIVVVGGELRVAHRINIERARVRVDIVGVVMCVNSGDDGAATYEDGQLPQRRIELVENATALVAATREPIDPLPLGQVDVVADVVAISIHSGVLVDGGDEEGGAE